MNLRLLLGGLLVGGAIGLMVGGAVVRVPGDEGGKRQYPQGVALLLSIVGGAGISSALRGARPPLLPAVGSRDGRVVVPAEEENLSKPPGK